jgi:hypothetical protein
VTAITFDRIDWSDVWDMVRAPADFRRMVAHSDIGRGQSIEERVVDDLARRERGGSAGRGATRAGTGGAARPAGAEVEPAKSKPPPETFGRRLVCLVASTAQMRGNGYVGDLRPCDKVRREMMRVDVGGC